MIAVLCVVTDGRGNEHLAYRCGSLAKRPATLRCMIRNGNVTQMVDGPYCAIKFNPAC